MAVRSTVKEERRSAASHASGLEESQIHAIVDSLTFQKSQTVRDLLLYLWRNRGTQISEYAIGVEALGRKSDFDPKTDSTVRVNISRLRQKLKEYFDSEGRETPARISVPLGGHELGVVWSEPAEAPPAQPPRDRRLVAISVLIAALLALACGWLIVENRRLAAPMAQKRSSPALPRFWQFFTANGKSIGVFLPTPVFFEWPSAVHGYLKMRDPRVNDFSDLPRSEELARYARDWGPPLLLQNYTVVSDTLAALKLSQFFDTNGIRLAFGTTADLSLDALGEHNTILLGTPGISSPYLKKLSGQENFQFVELGHDLISHNLINRHPRAGERSVYTSTAQSNRRFTMLGIIAVLPGKTSGALLLTMTAQQTAPLASLLTTPVLLQVFDSAWRKAGAPAYFETLVEVEMDGSTALRAWPVAFREIRGIAWEESVTTR